MEIVKTKVESDKSNKDTFLLNCNYCDKRFSSRIRLEKHITAEHIKEDNRVIICELCHITFKKISNLKMHRIAKVSVFIVKLIFITNFQNICSTQMLNRRRAVIEKVMPVMNVIKYLHYLDHYVGIVKSILMLRVSYANYVVKHF